ncbi:signal-regulatory protein beta-1 isoform X2 [Paramormyrops kingsleyae]|uniref:signal-regulatory protein beta-1 isoform X2 n=1 Tax=Paramormyrops kingsleyae TaxID=1676925 RepID=UPI000CD65BC6|nr:signal-regulatory protein beta-1-like isoform X2 [Paramormyrops kingsleyae]
MTRTALLLQSLIGLNLLGIRGSAATDSQTAVPQEIIYATLGLPLDLTCTYNCSSGWVRGNWCLWKVGQPDCQPVQSKVSLSEQRGVCGVSLSLRLASTYPAARNYSCFSLDTNSPELSGRAERHVMVQVQASPSSPVLTVSREESGSSKVTCTSGGFYPRTVTVTWSHNGSPLDGAKDNIVRSEPNGTFSVCSTITVGSLTPHRRGTLSCEIHHVALSQPLRCDSSLGEEHPSLQVYYSREAESSDKAVPVSDTIRTSVGGFLRLYCHVDGHSSSTVRWFRRNSTSQWLSVGTDTTLTMPEVKQEDKGSYMCQTGVFNSSVMVEIDTAGSILWLKTLAVTMLFVAMVLAAAAAFFCITHKAKHRGDSVSRSKSEPTINEGRGAVATQAGCQSEQEVPYADIIISVRGSSSPELSNAPDSAPGDYGKRWQGEASQRALLQTSRSADRLHVHQREVARKMSTGSEYAVITYYPLPMS